MRSLKIFYFPGYVDYVKTMNSVEKALVPNSITYRVSPVNMQFHAHVQTKAGVLVVVGLASL